MVKGKRRREWKFQIFCSKAFNSFKYKWPTWKHFKQLHKGMDNRLSMETTWRVNHKKEVKNPSTHVYYVGYNSNRDLDLAIVEDWLETNNTCNWSTFDDYVKSESAIYSIIINISEWILSRCSCDWYKKIPYVNMS